MLGRSGAIKAGRQGEVAKRFTRGISRFHLLKCTSISSIAFKNIQLSSIFSAVYFTSLL